MYAYDPKLKATLPYYDRFPLAIVIDVRKNGFDALNLHYLRPDIRAAFLDELLKLGPSEPTEKSRLTKLRYNLIKGSTKFKEFKPCYKRYLSEHVKSSMARVPMTDW